MTALELANYIVNRAIEAGRPVSNLKLQKILYFANLLHIRRSGSFLIEDIDKNPFEAWRYGPVIATVYNRFSNFRGLSIDIFQQEPAVIEGGIVRDINHDINQLIRIEPWTLVEWSHAENGAWDKTYRGGLGSYRVISEELIREDAGVADG